MEHQKQDSKKGKIVPTLDLMATRRGFNSVNQGETLTGWGIQKLRSDLPQLCTSNFNPYESKSMEQQKQDREKGKIAPTLDLMATRSSFHSAN